MSEKEGRDGGVAVFHRGGAQVRRMPRDLAIDLVGRSRGRRRSGHNLVAVLGGSPQGVGPTGRSTTPPKSSVGKVEFVMVGSVASGHSALQSSIPMRCDLAERGCTMIAMVRVEWGEARRKAAAHPQGRESGGVVMG